VPQFEIFFILFRKETLPTRVARWFVFKPKSNLGKMFRASDSKMSTYFMAIWNILWIFGIFYDHSLHFVFIWYIFPVLVSRTKKNLATLLPTGFAGSNFRLKTKKKSCRRKCYLRLD
jgi:hypothetical protein